MLFGIISDTHITDRVGELPDEIYDKFKNVNKIIHCGDITSNGILDNLNSIDGVSEVIAVKGNMDTMALPKEIFLEINGFKIGIFHGDKIYPRGDLLKMKYYCLENELDVLISGHTHIPLIKKITIPELNKNILLLNPGSPTVPRFPLKTVMSFEIKKDVLKPEIILIE
ncbi:phosphodiesterase, MJ0936 family [Methanococcus aeolicus Nankai-3]|uniref:Phosphoesterase n=1 Tax=Methanococcus aeolicus (strain ATCC BAA-1280 / DSM 17508 / OCM 812 / Nankai-3) TaxID=419665 RepID=A6UWJ1_META3|nr:YfcE family phosphodiesterase [Methanococcus aeolicus]ABR56863.1 phosphodiesterase, MJ0936 family [Methanococcus aeolicus Nankai-3]